MGDSKASFFLLELILLVVFVMLIGLVFDLRRLFFMGELLIIVALVLFAFVAIIGVYNNHNWGYVLLSFVFAGVLVDMLLLFNFHRELFLSKRFMAALILSSLGFVLSIVSIKVKQVYKKEKLAPSVIKTFSPGKFVASAKSANYHAPNCDWAKKIHPDNRIWFSTETEANKSYKPHSCIRS